MLSMTLLALAASASPILHYVRSNRDGSEAEHVVQFRPSRTRIAVYKWVEHCTTAAYVTAEMGKDVRDARVYVAGKVARDGRQAKFGTLRLDSSGQALAVDITPPGGEQLRMTHKLKARPYIIFDFDLADLNAFLQEHRPKGDFAYELPVIWPSDPALFRDLGQLQARRGPTEKHGGRTTVRYDLSVAGPTPSTGTLWVDANHGFIVEAELGLPNHAEYKDFRLKLDEVQRGGEKAWAALTAGQYADCPAGN